MLGLLQKENYFLILQSEIGFYKKYTIMAVTRLQRKHRKNIARAKAYVKDVSRLLAKPTLKSVDVEAIKKEFAEKKAQQA